MVVGARQGYPTYLVSLTRAPRRLDGARISLLPEERHRSAAQLQRELPDIADALVDGRLFGPLWSEVGTKHEATFATYGALRNAFPGLAEHIRMHAHKQVDDSVPDVGLVVYITRPDRR